MACAAAKRTAYGRYQLAEVRGNYDGESRDHFHRGLDIQANQR